jgi:hypothetical protein
MRVLLPKLREVIRAVNVAHPWDEQVAVSTVAKAICEQGVVHELVRIPAKIDLSRLVGQYSQHVSDDGVKTGAILHKEFPINDPFSDPDYPEIRFGLVKEMMHAFDSEEEKTKQHQAVVDLTEALLAKELLHSFSADHYADRRAVFGAIELLIRFELRALLLGGSLTLRQCKSSGDWTKVGQRFGVPHWVANIAFNERYNDYIRTLRDEARIPLHDFFPNKGS